MKDLTFFLTKLLAIAGITACLLLLGKKNSAVTPTAPIGDNATMTKFVHPGILNTRKQMNFFIEKINANEEPWKTAFLELKSSPYASLEYKCKPYVSVDCGSYNKPNVGCDQQVLDGIAVYAQALMYVITQDKRYAQHAAEIVHDWSQTYQKNTQSNARLVVSWAAPWYANGAEILRYSYPDWTPASTEEINVLLNKWLPYVADDTMPGNNWIFSAIEAHMAIAVFQDNREMFESAVGRWKVRVPTYIYNTSDGPKPINGPNSSDAKTARIWRDQARSTTYINGLAMESCRDLGHLNLGFNSMMYGAETAWNQNIDVFTGEKKRLAEFMELHASWMTGSQAVPNDVCDGTIKAVKAAKTGIAPPQGGGQTTWEIAYNHLHDRLGMDLPFTRQMLVAKRPQAVRKWVDKGDTLTHAGRIFE